MNRDLFLILVIVSISTHLIRTIYEILKHKKIIAANKFTFVIIFTNMMLLWVSWVLLCANDIFRIEPTGILKYLGLAFFIIGIVVFLMGLYTIKSLENYDGDLITKGIYSTIRHPMYLGFILWLIGAPVFFGAIFSSILSLFYIANVLFWRYLEEKELVDRFPSYRDYKKHTIF
jgi:protein-S-isoprenylcysteine O-methyltransferase Ste14